MSIDNKHPEYEANLQSWEDISAAVKGKKANVGLQIPDTE